MPMSSVIQIIVKYYRMPAVQCSVDAIGTLLEPVQLQYQNLLLPVRLGLVVCVETDSPA